MMAATQRHWTQRRRSNDRVVARVVSPGTTLQNVRLMAPPETKSVVKVAAAHGPTCHLSASASDVPSQHLGKRRGDDVCSLAIPPASWRAEACTRAGAATCHDRHHCRHNGNRKAPWHHCGHKGNRKAPALRCATLLTRTAAPAPAAKRARPEGKLHLLPQQLPKLSQSQLWLRARQLHVRWQRQVLLQLRCRRMQRWMLTQAHGQDHVQAQAHVQAHWQALRT